MRVHVLAATLLALTNQVVGQHLVDALKAAGASKFAAFIQSNPASLKLYLSGQVRTVYAPSDSVAPPVALASRDSRLRRRQAGGQPDDQAAYQAQSGEVALGQASEGFPGQDFATLQPAPKTGGPGQVVVSDTRPANTTHPTKRQAGAKSLLRFSSGLGQSTNVIKGDIPFDGGLIHLTDSYFTLAEPLSSTAQKTGQTTFASFAASSNLTSVLENTNSVTVFLPSNAAFAAGGWNVSTSSLISSHVVSGFVGYLPQLTDGAALTTQNGETLKISIRSGIYYVNNAKITQANLILENGVAHVIDKVLAPAKPAVVISGSPFSKAPYAPYVVAGMVVAVLGFF